MLPLRHSLADSPRSPKDKQTTSNYLPATGHDKLKKTTEEAIMSHPVSEKSALVVSAHSADFVWRAGGAIALHALQGYQVHVVCLSG